MPTKTAVYNGLSDSLAAAIDTGNIDEVAAVLQDAEDCEVAGQITVEQLAELTLDAQVAGYDF